MRRRDLLRLVATAAAVAPVVGCGAGTGHGDGARSVSSPGMSELLAAPHQPLARTTVAASSTSVNHMWAGWGIARGFYKRYGLDVTAEDNVTNAVAAMAAGRLDFSASGVATQSGAVQGAPVKVAMLTFRDNLAVYGDPSIRSVTDLKGKRILGPDDMIKAILEKHGINGDKDVTWVQNSASSTNQSIQLIRQGRADAFTGYPPAGFLAQQAGLVTVTSVADVYPGSPVSIVGTSAALMERDPLLVKRFLAGTLDALTDMKANKAAVVGMFEQSWGFDAQLADQTYSVIPRDMFDNGQTDSAALQVVLDVTKSAQGSTANIPLDRVWDFTLLNQVLADRSAGAGQ
jgi:ABC-type nitrate/sulfonate/bicarbonate transport system substrate-binding protein